MKRPATRSIPSALNADKELFKDYVFGAFNFFCEPEVTYSYQAGCWQRATLGFFGSVTTQVQPDYSWELKIATCHRGKRGA